MSVRRIVSPITAHAVAFAGSHGDDRVALVERGDVSIVVLADGAGGLAGGAVAAEHLIAIVRENVSLATFAPMNPESWVELLERADVDVSQHSGAGETTAVLVAVSEHGLVGASAGDSGAWVVHPDRVDELTAAQERKLRIGSERARPLSFIRPRLGGTLLVATDGLLSYASRESIARLVQQPDLGQAARELIQLVRLPTGTLRDDVGVVLVRPASVR